MKKTSCQFFAGVIILLALVLSGCSNGLWMFKDDQSATDSLDEDSQSETSEISADESETELDDPSNGVETSSQDDTISVAQGDATSPSVGSVAENNEDIPALMTSPKAVKGYLQKGPFMANASVIISELNEKLEATDHVYLFTVEDDLGYFETSKIVSAPFIEIVGEGIYFNEVSGRFSDSNATLRALVEVKDNMNMMVNVLTTLSTYRLKYLFNNPAEVTVDTEGSLFANAKKQTEIEVLKNVFGVKDLDITHFDKMDLFAEGKSHGILLAASAVLQGSDTASSLTALLNQIAIDMSDGKLDSVATKNKITANQKKILPAQIRENLLKKYEKVMGKSFSITEFEDFLDSDGDGDVNKNDLKAPTVKKVFPLDNSLDVALNTTIQVTFSEPLDNESLDQDSFMLSIEGDAVSGSLSYDPESQTATFKPNDNLEINKTYIATLSEDIRDMAGNALNPYNFSFLTADTIAPVVKQTSPLANTAGVEVNAQIIATFDDLMTENTLDQETFVLTKDGVVIKSDVSYDAITRQAVLTPVKTLDMNSEYRATLGTNVTDASGNPMAQEYSWSFKTIDLVPERQRVIGLYSYMNTDMGDFDGDGITEIMTGDPTARNPSVDSQGITGRGGVGISYNATMQQCDDHYDYDAFNSRECQDLFTQCLSEEPDCVEIAPEEEECVFKTEEECMALLPEQCQPQKQTECREISKTQTQYGAEQNSYFGMKVAVVGDVNNDGASDYVVLSGSGWLQLFSGLDNALIKSINNAQNHFYESKKFSVVNTIGDIDQDGVKDLMADFGSVPTVGSSQTLLLFSGKNLALIGKIVNTLGSYSSIGSGGDLDHDGHDDFYIANSRGEQDSEGAVHVYSGKTKTILYKINGNSRKKNMGLQVIAFKEKSTDTESSLLVLSRLDHKKQQGFKTAVLTQYIGAQGVVGWEDVIESEVPVTEPQNGHGFGFPVKVFDVGDVNLDEYNDLVISKPYWASGRTTNIGMISVISGKDKSRLYDVIGDQQSGMFGVGALGGFDWNNDGLMDFAVMDHNHVYIYVSR
ncbi:MAG: Ig-like domain-containing protein [Deltaproteobacteria bacterium]|nr:Ig-like domain-containing protein [Deltaproteobacteria bacterium]